MDPLFILLNPWAFAGGSDARREQIWLSWCDIKEFPTPQTGRWRMPRRAAKCI